MAALKLERVLISDKTDPCCEEILRQGGISVEVKPKLPKDQLLKEIEVERASRVIMNWCRPKF